MSPVTKIVTAVTKNVTGENACAPSHCEPSCGVGKRMRWERRYSTDEVEHTPSKRDIKNNPATPESAKDAAVRARRTARELYEKYPHLFPKVPEYWKK